MPLMPGRTALLIPVAAIRNRPMRATWTGLSSAAGFCIFGFMAYLNTSLRSVGHNPHSAVQVDELTIAVSSVGLLTILVLTSAAISLSVRAELKNLAVLKAIGFSSFRIVTFIFLEATIPSCAGMAIGLLAAKLLILELFQSVPNGKLMPSPHLSALSSILIAVAVVAIPLLSCLTAVPKVLRLHVATILASPK